MAKIYLRGGISHDIDNEQAKGLKEQWKGGQRGVVDFGNVSFSIGEVKAIFLDDEGGKNEKWKTYLENDRKWKAEFRSKTAEEKTKQTKSFSGLIFKLAEKEYNPEVEKEISDFYEANPNRCFPDMNLYDKYVGDWHFPLSIIQDRVLGAVIRTVNNDIEDAKRMGDKTEIINESDPEHSWINQLDL